MNHLDKHAPDPGRLRRLLRPGPRPWFRRPAPDPLPGAGSNRVRPDEGRAADEALAFERLVERYVRMSMLLDRALAETHAGEDALSVGDALKAAQHFASSKHYRRRARAMEAAIQVDLESLAQERAPSPAMAAEALRTARQRLYGSPEAHSRPEFA